MREIKFRAWKYPKEFVNNQKLEGEMLYVEMKSEKNYMASSHTGWMFYVYKEDMSDVMQFTGLLDKNGKDVYEGDVVEYYVPQAGFNYKRRFTHVIAWDSARTGYDMQWSNLWEVIGNIYENPELLNSSMEEEA